MRRLAILLCLPALVCAADLTPERSVYLMPMFRGLEQYLANRLASNQVLRVVTDPKRADAFFTDRIGEHFEGQLESLQFVPAPAPAEGEKADEAALEPGNKLSNPAANSAFGRGKGTIFLVDAQTRQVIWSTYLPPEGPAGKQMDRAAADIVGRLMKDMGLKRK